MHLPMEQKMKTRHAGERIDAAGPLLAIVVTVVFATACVNPAIPETEEEEPEQSQNALLAQVDMQRRWPEGVIPFEIDADLGLMLVQEDGEVRFVSMRDVILDGLKGWSDRTPIRFRPRQAGDNRWLRFKRQGPPPLTSWSEGGIGMPQCPFPQCEHIVKIQPIRSDGQMATRTQLLRVVVHEVGHVIGLYHEHTRSDRDAHLRFDATCGGDLVDQWIDFTNSGVQQKGHILGPYDLMSVMHYSSSIRTRADGTPCFDFVRTDNGLPVVRSTLPTPEDVNGVWLMYGPRAGAVAAEERFGESLLAHDFDGDGYGDLAVGAPGARAKGVPNAGVVYFFKGTAKGFVFWGRLRAPSPQAGGEFGAALAAANLDGDGEVEIAVGAPGMQVSGKAQAGQVFVGFIHQNGFADIERILSKQDALYASAVEAHDRFGHTLTTGEFYENERMDLAIAAPGARIPGSVHRAGNVFVLRLHDGLTNLHRIRSTDDALDSFWRTGWALATVHRAGSSTDGLVVSAPALHVGSSLWSASMACAPVVTVLGVRPGTPGLAMTHTLSQPVDLDPKWKVCSSTRRNLATDEYPASELRNFFGDALAAGDIDNNQNEANEGSRDDVVVATPLGSDSARVFVFRGAMDLQFAQARVLGTAPTTGGLLLGRPGRVTLATSDFDRDGFEDLAVGLPLATRTQDAAGRAYLYAGTSTLFGQSASELADSRALGAKAHFGSALAFAESVRAAGTENPDARPLRLLVGVPGAQLGNAADAGRVAYSGLFFPVRQPLPWMTSAMTLVQQVRKDTSSPWAP